MSKLILMRPYKDELAFSADVMKLIESFGDYHPDVIVPLLRGGSAPQVYVAESLGVMDVRPVSIERLEVGTPSEKRTIAYPPNGDIGDVDGLDVLLLEDDIPTGKSLLFAKQYLESKGARVKIAAVYVKPDTKHIADFYGEVCDPLPDLYWKPSRAGNRVVRKQD